MFSSFVGNERATFIRRAQISKNEERPVYGLVSRGRLTCCSRVTPVAEQQVGAVRREQKAKTYISLFFVTSQGPCQLIFRSSSAVAFRFVSSSQLRRGGLQRDDLHAVNPASSLSPFTDAPRKSKKSRTDAPRNANTARSHSVPTPRSGCCHSVELETTPFPVKVVRLNKRTKRNVALPN